MDFLSHVLAGSLTDVALTRALERLQHLAGVFRDRVDDATLARLLGAEAFRADPFVYGYLRHHLEAHPVEVAGRPARMMSRDLLGRRLDIPVVLIGAGPVHLRPLSRQVVMERDEGWRASEYVRLQQRLGRVVEDRDCYSARRLLVTPGGAAIEGGLTSYGSALANQDVLEWELLDQASQHARRHREVPAYGQLTPRLRRRRALEERTPNYLLDGSGHGALAISTLIVHPVAGGHGVMLGKRSATTGAHADLFHVIPACMFQPELGNLPAEWDLTRGFLKEYGEELYRETLDPGALDPSYFYRAWPGVASLRSAIRTGRCVFTVTGLVVSLLNLRPEVCCLLLVKDRAWWRREHARMRLNWEYVPPQRIGAAFRQPGRTWTDLRLESAEADYLDYFGASPGQWVPAGLAALWLGVDAARRALAAG